MAWHSKMSKEIESSLTLDSFVFLSVLIRKVRVFHSMWSHIAGKKEHFSLLILITFIYREEYSDFLF